MGQNDYPIIKHMKGPLFYAKILLFGEYGIIKDSKGLAIPYNTYQGALKKSKNLSEQSKKSNENLKKYFVYLAGLDTTLVTFRLAKFKKDIEEVSDFLFEAKLPHSVFYGDLDQEEREKSLLKFRNGSNHILLATDLAARGLDIPEIKNIIHFQIPSKEDTFIHSFCHRANFSVSA